MDVSFLKATNCYQKSCETEGSGARLSLLTCSQEKIAHIQKKKDLQVLLCHVVSTFPFDRFNVFETDSKIISDFDMTLTKFMVNGARGKSCHRIVEDNEFLSDHYRKVNFFKV